jgi:hypothetical protein
MKEKKKRQQDKTNFKERKIKKAYARRHEVSPTELLILAILFSGLFFALYMIEKYQ